MSREEEAMLCQSPWSERRERMELWPWTFRWGKDFTVFKKDHFGVSGFSSRKTTLCLIIAQSDIPVWMCFERGHSCVNIFQLDLWRSEPSRWWPESRQREHYLSCRTRPGTTYCSDPGWPGINHYCSAFSFRTVCNRIDWFVSSLPDSGGRRGVSGPINRRGRWSPP